EEEETEPPELYVTEEIEEAPLPPILAPQMPTVNDTGNIYIRYLTHQPYSKLYKAFYPPQIRRRSRSGPETCRSRRTVSLPSTALQEETPYPTYSGERTAKEFLVSIKY
ncbi:hypothetical protein HF086_000908, partial [Spodoptera exigua]